MALYDIDKLYWFYHNVLILLLYVVNISIPTNTEDDSQKFQSVEESHLDKMLQFVQTYINVLQSTHEAMGQVHQDLLTQYSEFSIEKLLDKFALSKCTGLEKPSKI